MGGSPILAKANFEIPILGVGLHPFDGLDLQASERAPNQLCTPEQPKSGGATHRVGNVGEVDEAALLLAQRIDQLNLAILAKVLSELLLRVEGEILNVADLR